MIFANMRWHEYVLSAVTLLIITAAAQSPETYCSSVNTGSDFNGIYNTYNSHLACTGNCTSAGSYAFAIVQGNLCWCSDIVPGASVRVGVSRCGVGCPGYPAEDCGDPTNHLYGYLALGPAPAGTAGGSSAAASSTPSPSTVVVTSSQIVVSTSTMDSVSTQVVSISTQNISATPASSTSSTTTRTVIGSPLAFTSTSSSSIFPSATSSSPVLTSSSMSTTISTTSTLTYTSQTSSGSAIAPVTVVSTFATTEKVTQTVVPTPISSASESTLVTPSIITVSNTPTTVRYVTTTISSFPTATGEQANPQPVSHSHSSSLSGGAIAGIAIGAVAGLAILAALLWLCCFRRRKGGDEEKSSLTRNTSILSKVGWGRHRGNSVATAHTAPDTPATIQRTPTGPLFQDSRLNPNIGTWRGDPAELPGNMPAAGLGILHDNGSQSSLEPGDHRDYSRPLAIRNPDPV